MHGHFAVAESFVELGILEHEKSKKKLPGEEDRLKTAVAAHMLLENGTDEHTTTDELVDVLGFKAYEEVIARKTIHQRFD